MKINEAMGGKRNHGFEGKDEIGDFWVVTDPSRMQEATLSDISFQADIFDMALQLRGGLKGYEIIGIFKTEAKARKLAKKLLDLDMKKRKLKEGVKTSFKDLFEAKGQKVLTTKDAGHHHEATLDDEGDGKTSKTIGGGKDHVHKIVGGEVQKAAGHGHLLKD